MYIRNWFVLTDILLANGAEPNLILSKSLLVLFTFFFLISFLAPCTNKHCQMETVKDFAFQFATFSLQNIIGLGAGLDGKIQTPVNIHKGQIKFVNLVVPSPCETEPFNNLIYYQMQLSLSANEQPSPFKTNTTNNNRPRSIYRYSNVDLAFQANFYI